MLAAALASALVAAAVASAANGRQHPARTPAAVPGSIIVGFKSNVSAKGRAGVLGAVDARPTKRFAQIDSTVVSVSPANTNWTIRTLEQDPRVAYAEPNFILHAATASERPVLPAGVGPRQHGPDGELHDGHGRRGHRRQGGVVRLDGQSRRHGRGHRHRRRRHASRSRPEHLDQRGRELPGLPDERDRRRRRRLRRRLARLGLREPRQQPDGRQRPRNARRGDDRRGRQQRRRRDRRHVEQHDHAAQVPRLEWIRVDRGRDQRDPLRARQGRPDHEQLVGRRRLLAGARGRDRADGRERRALRRGRGQRLHEHGLRAVLAVELRHAEHHLGRRERPVRPQGLVLELRRAHGRPLRAGHERLLDVEGLDATASRTARRWPPRTSRERPRSSRRCSRMRAVSA